MKRRGFLTRLVAALSLLVLAPLVALDKKEEGGVKIWGKRTLVKEFDGIYGPNSVKSQPTYKQIKYIKDRMNELGYWPQQALWAKKKA